MNTIVISDTHGRINSVIALLQSRPDISRVIHLGDTVRDAEDLESIFTDIEFISVRGNNDYFSRTRDEAVTEIGTRKVFMTHGHFYSVKSTMIALVKRAKELGADTVLFGHTHMKCDTVIDGITLLNPSASGYILFNRQGGYQFCDL